VLTGRVCYMCADHPIGGMECIGTWGSPRSTSRRFDGSAERKESVWVWKLR
jgi:hypothetical protein